MRRYWWLAVVFCGVAFRLFLLLRREPLWYDEAFSVVLASLDDAKSIISASSGDVHPPFYYLLLSSWGRAFGYGETAMRSMSFFHSVLSVLVYWKVLGMFYVDDKVKHVAVALVSWVPSLSFFSVEARMYALFSLLFLLAVAFLFDKSRGSLNVIFGPLYGGAVVGLLCLTHNVGLLYAPAIAFSMFVYSVRSGFTVRVAFSRVLIMVGMAMIVYSPWVPSLLSQLETASGGYWITPPSIAGILYHLGQSFLYLISHAGWGIDAAMLVVVSSMTIFGVVVSWRSIPELLVVPVLVLFEGWALSHVLGVGMIIHRALIPFVYIFVIGWAFLLVRVDVGKALAVPVCAMLIVSSSIYAHRRVGADYSVWNTIEVIDGDVVFCNNSSLMPLLLYGPRVPLVVYDGQVSPVATGLSFKTLEEIGIGHGQLESIEWHRAWFLWFRTPYTGESEIKYRESVLSRYNARFVADLGGDDFTSGELWLLSYGETVEK